ncbi:MAG: metal-binding protein [Cyanobacteria bacterium J06621_8]
MPSGIIHDRITFWLLPCVAIITYSLTRNGELTLILSGGFLFSGMMFGPDLDIHSLQYKRWGAIRWIWLPYRNMMVHRSILSHGFIIGTLLRLIYLGLIITLLAMMTVAIAQLIWGFPWNWQNFVRDQFNLLVNQYHRETISLLLGLELGAMSHSFSDWISSQNKVRLRQKRNQPKTTKKLRKAKIYQKKK